ncbi:helix-turn-helix transcriptional regulator [Micromonospora sp. A3M-1-15]|uniref:helix-turn-helix domain-containing protein n=1 Tax=Micromonospora sp. A3M-1-15 TaxID=2962035 RepID=UPI0020B791C6|nr:helix-turn-helix transcriptional regulator [Micromonospora sp. A3M-1-15]MCP3786175.1 helix-turn-helix transcriptional regulator [Micromonospora sp. A3M-1-15]
MTPPPPPGPRPPDPRPPDPPPPDPPPPDPPPPDPPPPDPRRPDPRPPGPRPLGPLLAELRAARGWSQQRVAAELCAAAGVPTLTRHEVSRWERQRRLPGDFWSGWLAVVLGVPGDLLAEAAARSRRLAPGGRPALRGVPPAGRAPARSSRPAPRGTVRGDPPAPTGRARGRARGGTGAA